MKLIWSSQASEDIEAVHDFLALKAPRAALDAVWQLYEAAELLRLHPRMGERIQSIGEEELRRVIVGRYELRYEPTAEAIHVLRIFHTFQDR